MCEIEFKGHEMLPRVVVAVGVMIGLLGVGAYLKSGPSRENIRSSVTPRALVERPVTAAPQPVEAAPRVDPQPAATREVQPAPVSPAPVRPPVVASEPQFYCGAETKKGTPCSRRVKGNVRCFQHVGMPAMAGAERLAAIK